MIRRAGNSNLGARPRLGCADRISQPAIAVAALLLLSSPARAVEPDEVLANPALETRARALSAGLRCLVCQNQSIDDSNAGLARDLRLLVRERLAAGDSDDAVLRFVVARYGEFVLLRPPFGFNTVLLWGAAPALVVVAGLALWRHRAATRSQDR